MVKIGEKQEKRKFGQKSKLNENRGGINEFCGNRGIFAKHIIDLGGWAPLV